MKIELNKAEVLATLDNLTEAELEKYVCSNCKYNYLQRRKGSKFIRIAEMSKELDVSRQTIYNYIDKKQLKTRIVVNTNGSCTYRTLRSDYEEFKKNNLDLINKINYDFG